MDFIIIHLAYRPSSSERSWASGILDQYPNHRAIISTHDCLNSSGMSSAGSSIWSNVVKKHDNVFMVVCGHSHHERMFVYKNNFGNNVYHLLADYQDDNPQIAKLRYYTFKPAENAVYAYTYSTYKNKYYTDSDSQFKFTYKMDDSSGGSPPNGNEYPSANGKSEMYIDQVLRLDQYLTSSDGKFRHPDLDL